MAQVFWLTKLANIGLAYQPYIFLTVPSDWMELWIDAALPKLKSSGSLYIILTWRYSPEIFVMLKQRMQMMNEIIWDRRVPSMGAVPVVLLRYMTR